MRNLLYLLTLLFFISCSKDADNLKNISPGLEWTHDLYTEDGYNLASQGMASTTDNGFLLIRADTLRKHNSDGDYEFTTAITANKIIRTVNGFLIYQKNLSTVAALNDDLSIDWQLPFNDNIRYLSEVNNGYLMLHSTTSTIVITKLSQDGQVDWQKTMEQTGDTQLNAIQKATNGYIAIGQKPSTDIGKNIWILHLDDSGEIIWEKTHKKNGTLNAKGVDIYQLDNGNFLALTSSSATSVDYGATSIMIFDNKGELINENQFGNTYFESMMQTNDGDFLAIGSGYLQNKSIPNPAPYSYNYSYYSAISTKINQEGNRIWQLEKLIGQYDDMARSVIQTKDNGFVVIANGSDEYSDYYLKIFKINPED